MGEEMVKSKRPSTPIFPRRSRAADSFPKGRNHVFTARAVAVRLAASAAGASIPT